MLCKATPAQDTFRPIPASMRMLIDLNCITVPHIWSALWQGGATELTPECAQ